MKIYRNNGGFGSYLIIYRSLFFKTATPRKIFNAGILGLEYLFRSRVLKSRPIIAKFETTSLCNLSCPFCRHGAGAADESAIARRAMSSSTFETILEEIHSYVFLMFMYHKGEPFLNRELTAMLRAAKEKNVATVVSSNLNIGMDDARAEEIVSSGLTYLLASIDGATQEVYEKYRVGGDISIVLGNLRKIQDAKMRLGSKTPHIGWQFIEFDHSRHEAQAAQNLAEQIGVDHFILTKNKEESVQEGYTLGGRTDGGSAPWPFPFVCKWLWSTALFLYDGQMVPCCYYDWDNAPNFGNALNKGLEAIWNGDDYSLNREIVASRVKACDRPDAYCSHCPQI